MKKIISIITIALISFSCSNSDLTSLNENEKKATVVPASVLITSAEKTLTDQMVNTNVNKNIFRLVSQQWTETTYTDESNYDWGTRKISDRVWQELYAGALTDLNKAKASIESEVIPANDLDFAGKTNVKNNQLAVIDILMVYTYQVLVDTFGDIPYSQSLQENSNFLPVYDGAASVYTDLISRLNSDINKINTTADSFDDADVIYNGNMAKWKKVANSIKLKLGINLLASNTNNTLASSTILSAVTSGVIASNSDNCKTPYETSSPNQNQLYLDLVASGRHDFVVTKPYVDKLIALNDPRRPLYTNGGVNGGIVGASNSYGSKTHVSSIIETPNLSGTLLDYAEVEFLLAEAVERGIAVGGTAESHYNNAITASMQDWGVASADITTYLARTDVAYTTATGTWKQKIGEQAWLGLYNRGFEAWTSIRRLDFPVLAVPTTANAAAEGRVPVRMTYPVREQTLNPTNYNAAATAIGGDKLSTKIFWDKF